MLDVAHLADAAAGKTDAGPGAPLEPAAPPRLAIQPHEVALSEFALAGVISAGEGWIALAHAPTGTLHAYRVGDRLADATVSAIFAADVVLDTDDGPLRLGLALLH